jgi:CDP-glucose 4,6-dehydratase
VTGAQGFIGSWLAKRLVDLGARVVAPRRRVVPGCHFERAGLEERCELDDIDILDVHSVLGALERHRVEGVFHLAAATIAGAVADAPLAGFDVNVRGTYTLLEACRILAEEGRGPRVVVASSYHVYGDHGGAAYREDFALRATHPYGVSKACADVIARSYATRYGMPIAVTRLANVYGGGDVSFSRIVPDAARALVAGERPVIRSDGTPQREFMYIEDAVEAYLAVDASLERSELRGRVWNAGSGEAVSVEELVRRLIAVSGGSVEPEIQLEPRAGAPVDRQVLESGAIREELGWTPQWTLGEGLAATYAWYEASLPAVVGS